jgi:potassium efflux system protein
MLRSLPVFLLMLTLLPSSASAQDAATLTTDLVDQRINTLKAQGAEDDNDQVVAYNQVRTLLDQAQGYSADYQNYVQSMSEAPQQTQQIQDQLDQLDDYDPAAEIAGFSPEEMAAQLALTRAERSELDDNLSALDRRLASRESNSSTLRSRLDEIQERLDQLAGEPLTISVGAAPSLAEAQQWRSAAEIIALNAEEHAKEAQLASQPARYGLMAAQRAQMAMTLEHLDALIEELGKRAASEAAGSRFTVEVSLDQSDPAYPLARDLADRQISTHAEQVKMTRSLSDVRSLIEENARISRVIDDRFATAKRIVEFAAGSEVLGQVLLSYWDEIQDLRLAAPASRFSSAVGSVVISRIEHEDTLAKLTSAPKYVNQLLRESDLDPDSVSAVTRGALLELARGYRESLRASIATESEYISALGTLESGYTEIDEKTKEYREFLAARLLWIPNHTPLWTLSPTAVLQEFDQITRTLKTIHLRFAPASFLAILAAGLLIRYRRRLRSYVERMSQYIPHPAEDSVRYTVQALGAITLQALPGPLLLFAIAATFDTEGSAAGGILNRLLAFAALLFFALDVMRRVAAEPNGIGTRHFAWPVAIMNRVREELDYMLRWWLPVTLMAAIVNPITPDSGDEVIGRVLILTSLVLITVHFGGHVVRELRATGRSWFSSTLNRLRTILLTVFVLMIGAVVYGQVFSVRVIAISIVNTIWVGIALLLVHAVLMRWLRVARRRLRLSELMSQRAQHAAGEEGGGIEEQLADLTDISSDTQQLVQVMTVAVALTAIVLIWGPLLPALEMFNNIELWTSTVTVDGQQVASRITMTTVIIVLALGGLTLFAAKRLPALVEIMLRSRTSISAGARYTISTLLNYLIIGIGIIAGLSALGLQWSQLQWLIAALGVGIGFGLQEIVANFISGLIILFERPIRVGDIVTIGDKDGTVTRIRIRATTIRDWDGKELLVPNKEFITGRLLNWTLSDSQTRVVIYVGIAYGSDVEQALKLLHDAVIEHPRTLEDPPPLIVFENFGDNALELSARCFLESLDGRLQVMTELRLAINKAFNEAGIVIAFPQRDVHLDTVEPIRIELQPAPGS